jgi:hypothetical protein
MSANGRSKSMKFAISSLPRMFLGSKMSAETNRQFSFSSSSARPWAPQPLHHLVHVLGGRQPGAEVEELVDVRLGGEEAAYPDQEGAVLDA